MQLEFSGVEIISASQDRVKSFLGNVDSLARSIPDLEEYHAISDSEIEAKVRLKISIISSQMHVKMKVKKGGEKITTLTEGKGGGSSIFIVTTFEFGEETQGKALVRWSANAKIDGLMAGLGSVVLKGFAERYIRQVIEKMKKNMES